MNWSSKTVDLLSANESNRQSVGLSQKTDLSALQIAALYDEDLADAMLDQGVACDLHSACALGKTDVVRQLGAQADLTSEVDLLPPIGYALLKGQTDSLSKLLELGDEASRLLHRIGFFVWEIELINHARWRPIHMAATHGYLDSAPAAIRMLVQHGARLDEPCMLGESSLHLASTYGWMDVMTTLIELGATVDLPTIEVADEIHKAASPSGEAPDLNVTPLMVASREGKPDAVRLLLQAGADVNTTSKTGRSALHFAAGAWWSPNPAVVEILLEAGANPELRDRQDNLPVYYAHKKEYDSVTEILNRSMN